jgi:SpoIID/LytB domain protein
MHLPPRRSPRSRLHICALLFFVSLAILVPSVASDGRRLLAQGDPTDGDLQAASGGRVIRVGALATDGHVTTLPLEVYVARVLAGEGEPRAAEAAQQALAIAIRTYALANLDKHGRDGYDLCDTTHCQVPRAATAASRRAALATAGQILTWRGAVAEVFYSASCGGRSEKASEVWPDVDLPYLQSRPDDVHEHDVPWTVDLSLADLQRALARAGFAGDRLRDVSIQARNASGRVSRVHLRGLRPDTISGDQFRAAVGATQLRSTAFSLTRNGDAVRFTGRGYGHGVGMCVIGAGRRAVRGESVAGILTQYYPGLQVTRLEAAAGKTPAAAPVAPATAAVVVPRSGAISVRVPAGSPVTAADLERLAARAHADLMSALGTSVAPVTIELHGTIESFRAATGRPWWTNATVQGTSIDLAPAALLAQREGVESAVRVALAELLVSSTYVDRPLWVRIGAARYFGRTAARAAQPPLAARVRCPSDAELTLALSVTAQREAEKRAEGCFARELSRTHDWRTVR